MSRLLFLLLCMISFRFHAAADGLDAETVARLNEAVVRIIAINADETISSGTGFFAGEPGEIITNYHVAAHAQSVGVFLMRDGGSYAQLFDADAEAADPEHDLLVLRIEAEDLPRPLEISKGQAKVLQDVIAVGFPGAIDSEVPRHARMRNGIVRNPQFLENLTPNITKGAISKVTAARITHDAKISHGNSGGPLIDLKTGKVLGVNSSGVNDAAATFYFAVPGSYARSLLQRKKASGASRPANARGLLLNAEACRLIINAQYGCNVFNDLDQMAYLYAPQIRNESTGKTLSRQEFLNDFTAYARRWPYRRYEILGVASYGSTAEVQLRYTCAMENGRQASGFSKASFTINRKGEIAGISETTSRTAPPSFHNKAIQQPYHGPRIFETPYD